ncbi:MAG: hypothetical protein ACR2LC_15910 [Pyrinomonadaceae bacterium]
MTKLGAPHGESSAVVALPYESVLAKLNVPTLFIAGKRDNWITPSLTTRARKFTTHGRRRMRGVARSISSANICKSKRHGD